MVDEVLARRRPADSIEQPCPRRSVWLPWQQLHEIGEPGRLGLMRAASWMVGPRDCAGVVLATSPAMVSEGRYAMLVTLRHRARARATVAMIEVLVDGDVKVQKSVVASRTHGWQREMVAFELARAGTLVLRVLSPGGHRLWTGTVSLCREPPRPFYAMAHMRNSPAGVARALAHGANAIECDVCARVEPGGRIALDAHHGFSIPYSRRGLARTPLRDYVGVLEPFAEQLALLVLDCKPSASLQHDYRSYGRALAETIAGLFPESRVLISVHDPSMMAVFAGAAEAGFAAGRDVNLIDNTAEFENPHQWIRFAEHHDLTALGIGTDCFVVGNLLRTWYAPIAAAVNGRDQRQRVKKVYYWTLQARAAIRSMLDYGLDGLIVNSPRGLLDVLAEPPFDVLYRLATPADSQFVVHGFEAAREEARDLGHRLVRGQSGDDGSREDRRASAE
jgi:hypothetical protein